MAVTRSLICGECAKRWRDCGIKPETENGYCPHVAAGVAAMKTEGRKETPNVMTVCVACGNRFRDSGVVPETFDGKCPHLQGKALFPEQTAYIAPRKKIGHG